MKNGIFKAFFESERTGGFLLIGCTVISLVLANTQGGHQYIAFFDKRIPSFGVLPSSLAAWINDGLMAVFFLLVGLEIKRELFSGELSRGKAAILPVLAAVGGMICPALIHFSFNSGLPTQRGFGIPMATDIAFALGVLSIAGRNSPAALKIFLSAIAIIDDLGAIAIIAVFYTSELHLIYLGLGLIIWMALFYSGRKFPVHGWIYILGGCMMWYLLLCSGIHPTISGVLLAFAIPNKNIQGENLSDIFQSRLHGFVAFIILPLFALANTAVIVPPDVADLLSDSNSMGIIAALVVGKSIGIFGISAIAVKMGWGMLPQGVSKRYLFAVSLLGGIGFTMSMFIADLAFTDPGAVLGSRMSILIGSATAAVLGALALWYARVRKG